MAIRAIALVGLYNRQNRSGKNEAWIGTTVRRTSIAVRGQTIHFEKRKPRSRLYPEELSP